VTIPIAATQRELEDANAFADEFLKEPIATDEESIEVCGFLLWQDGNDPVMSGVTIARPDPVPVPGKYRWVVEVPCIRAATYWEPEEVDTQELGRADTLGAAMAMVAHTMLDQEIRNFNECRFYEQLKNEEANA
jgi:hypothetical protein